MPSLSIVSRALKTGEVRPRILMLTHRAPARPDRGDRIRGHHLLRALADDYDVDLACTTRTAVEGQDRHTLETLTDRLAIRRIGGLGSTVRGLHALADGQPITPAWHHRGDLVRDLTRWHRKAPFDAIVCVCTGMLQCARQVRDAAPANRRPALLLDLVDVDSLKWASLAHRCGGPRRWLYHLESKRLGRLEAQATRFCDAISIISRPEAQAFERHVDGQTPLTVVANGVDGDYFRPLSDPNTPTLAFVGVLNYRPNVEGVLWFAHHVLPALRRRVSHLELLIAGRNPGPAIREVASQNGVTLLGCVPDVRTVLARASVVIAPLSLARGVQNKVLEAMACARPVVCSPQAAEGIDVIDGRHLIVAEGPEQWIRTLGDLLGDPARRGRIRHSARHLVDMQYTWKRSLAPMLKLVEKLVSNPDPRGRRRAA